MKKIIITITLLTVLFVLGCKTTQEIEVPILESYCISKGSSNCCNLYGCFVKVKIEEEILTHEYLSFEEDTCGHSKECNYPKFDEREHLVKKSETRIKIISGKYEFTELKKETKSNR